jgi:integrase
LFLDCEGSSASCAKGKGPSQRTPDRIARCSRALAKAIEDAGITYDKKVERVGFHGFRHGAVSALIRAGKDPVSVAAYVGDKVETILSTYAHLWKKDGDNLGQDLEAEVLTATAGGQS